MATEAATETKAPNRPLTALIRDHILDQQSDAIRSSAWITTAASTYDHSRVLGGRMAGALFYLANAEVVGAWG